MSADSWKVTLPCTRAEAEAIDAADDLAIDAVLMTTEEVEDDVERWRLDAYMEAQPDAAMLAAIRALVPSAAGTEPVVQPLTDADWVAMSQAGLEPIREGRFVVHTSVHPGDAPPGGRAFLIDAGQAFGTGHHFTTAGCLAMLDRLANNVDRFDKVVDLGTGTGLLAFAALELWPDALVLGTDIDPVAIEVARHNMAVNGIEHLELLVADGARNLGYPPGTFDLVIANILAGPLIDMAAEVVAIAAPHAAIVLAGLLTTQAGSVIAAYEAQGCHLVERDARGDWTILCLKAPSVRRATPGLGGDRTAWAGDR